MSCNYACNLLRIFDGLQICYYYALLMHSPAYAALYCRFDLRTDGREPYFFIIPLPV